LAEGDCNWLDNLPHESRAAADRVPPSLRRYVDASVGALLTPDVLELFTPEMRDWPAGRAWRALFKPTAFNAIRMEAEVGGVCAVSSPKHPRFPYFTYVPMRAQIDRVRNAPLLVTVHGSERNAYASRERFAEFAEANGCFVLAPLFPMDMTDTNPDEQYKYVYTEKVRFDLVVLDLIEEFSKLVGVEFGPLLMHGYSGGGQFVNRFLYLHAHRVAAASIGAPGYVTLPDFEKKYPVGLDGLEGLTGQRPNLEAIAKLPLNLMIGGDDADPIDVYSPGELGLNDAEYQAYGFNRLERLANLRDAYERLGAKVTYDIIPGHAHGTRVEPAVRFFERFLQGPL
jgi:poly(3-hydroxybutyrate) depolymerase